MNNIFTQLSSDSKVKGAVVGFIGVLSIFLLVQIVVGLTELRYVGSGVPASNTISVEGTGEAVAVPDIATINFSVRFEEATVAAAQEQATELTNMALAYLRDQNIEERDIQTTSYNVSPRYDFIQTACIPGQPCIPGRQELRGYEVSQSVSVTVRDLDQTGVILGGLGEMNVQNISGPNFEIEDIDAIRAEAREEAIAEAKAKANELARDLGVRVVRVVGFWEDTGGFYPYFGMESSIALDSRAGGAPEIPVGENEVTSRVNITYEIR